MSSLIQNTVPRVAEANQSEMVGTVGAASQDVGDIAIFANFVKKIDEVSRGVI